MRKLLAIFFLFISVVTVSAQNDDLMSAARDGFKDIKSITADVTQTIHNSSNPKDIISKGKFVYNKPDEMYMSFNNGKEKLQLLEDDSFVSLILKNLCGLEETDTDLEDLADIDMNKNGEILTLTIIPIIVSPQKDSPAYILTIDQKTEEFKSLRINEKDKNYTQYDFSNLAIRYY